MSQFDSKNPDEKTVVAKAPAQAADEFKKTPFLLTLTGDQTGLSFPLMRGKKIIIGRDPSCDLVYNENDCSRQHACIYSSPSGQFFLEDMGSTNGTYANGIRLTAPHQLEDGDRLSIGHLTNLKFTLQDAVEETFQSNIYRSATRDSMTGVYNKRYFLEALDREIRHHVRQKSPLCLIMMDLDHFKSINDTYGHLAGDEILKSVARIGSTTIRSENIFCRYGGEEFALILSNTTLESAARFAERLRELIATSQAQFEQNQITVTVSMGIALLDPNQASPEKLIQVADQQLYQAKKEGRNRVCVAHS